MILAAWLLLAAPSPPESPADDDFGILPTFDPTKSGSSDPERDKESEPGRDLEDETEPDGEDDFGMLPPFDPGAHGGVGHAEGGSASIRQGQGPDDAARAVVTGSLRLTGAFVHFFDPPASVNLHDDATALAVGRLLVDEEVLDGVRVELNVFGDLSRTASGGELLRSFASAGSTESAYRAPALTWTFWKRGSVRGTTGLDRFAVDFDAGPVTLQAGRFPINFSVTSAITPNDFFAPFSATAVNRIFKPGVDAVRLGAAVGARISIDVVGVAGYDAIGVPSAGRSAGLARVGAILGGFEWAVLGGRVAERWVAGGSAQGDLGPIGLRAEGHVGVPDEAGDGRGVGDGDRPVYGRVAAGPNVNFNWHQATLSAEYAYLSDGAARPGDDLARAQRLFPDDVPYLGRHYVSAMASLEIVPLLTGSALTLVNAVDGSGLAGLTFLYNIADESDLIIGSFIPWGARTTDADLASIPPRLGSEFGLSPLTLYLEARLFF